MEPTIPPVQKKTKKLFSVHAIARIAVFSAIATILYLLPFPPFNFPIFPQVSFLSIHFDEVPALIAGFAYGPLAGSLVIVIRTIIKLPFSSTAMVGELADLIFSLALVLPATLLYHQNRTLKGAIYALIFGTTPQVIVATAGNLYFIADFYNNLFGGAIFNLMDMGTYLKWLIPFNLIKDAMVSIVTFFAYKSVHRLFDRL